MILILKSLFLLLVISCSTCYADITCTYYAASVRFASLGESIMHLCRVDGFDFEMPIDLCDELLALNPESGTTILLLSNMTLNNTTQTIDIVSEQPIIKVLSGQSRSLLSNSRAVGQRSILVVRVLSKGGSQGPSISQSKLRDSIFGSPILPYIPSFVTQYDQCSQGALKFVPANSGGTYPGVTDVVLEEDWSGVSYDLVAQKTLYKAFAVQYSAAQRASFNHVLFCMPTAINGDFIAFATLNDNFSYFSDSWCTKISATTHEVGHNMGVLHSGIYGGSEYEDRTCTMGYGVEEENGPLRCFNGQKLWAFDWFPSHQRSVSLSEVTGNQHFSGSLAAFVDVSLTTMDIVYNIGDLYVVYNRATKHNAGVPEKRDQVTIVQGDTPLSNSVMLVGLDMRNPSFTTTANFSSERVSVMFKVCSIVLGKVDYATLLIGPPGKISCPTSRPTSSPTVIAATVRPTPLPTTILSTPVPAAPSRVIAAPTPPPIDKALGCSGDPGASCVQDYDCCGTTVCKAGTFGYICTSKSVGMSSYSITRGASGGVGGANMRRLRLNEGRKAGHLRGY